MKKPRHLLDTLVAALSSRHPAYATDPALTHMIVADLACEATLRPGAAFQERYTLAITLFDFPGEPEEIVVPLMIWVQRWQPDLLSPQRQNAVSTDVEYLETGKVDVLIRLQLTEILRFADRPGGGHDVVHVEEPLPMALAEGSPLHRVYLDGELIAACDHDVP